MKKILVLSDSHGYVNNMIEAVKRVKPDMILHLGDVLVDVKDLEGYFPKILVESVPGNCDCTMASTERILEIEGKRILICHGHTYQVKSTYLNLQYAAMEKEVDVALFGHTHKAFYQNHNGVIMMNPGSIGCPPYGIPPSYGILELDEDSDEIVYKVEYIDELARGIY